MRYLSIWNPDEKTAARQQTPEFRAAMAELMEKTMKSGELVATGGVLPPSMGGARVRRNGAGIAVTDGPFAEAKEVVVGWAILEAPSREAAIEIAKRFLAVAGEGECELRRIVDPGDEPRMQ